MSESKSEPVALPIREREVVFPEGEREVVRSVSCPRRGSVVEVEECQRCEHLQEVHGSAVLCDSPKQEVGAPPIDLHERLRSTRVSEVMTSQVTCVDSELYLDEATQVIRARGLHGAPVVEDRGVPVGMVSVSDLTSGEGVRRLVEDVMSTDVVTVSEDATLAEAVALLDQRRLHRMPVTGRDGTLVGLLSVSDLVRWLTQT
jgi:CBS domain-containing protein